MSVPGLLSVDPTNGRYFRPADWDKPILLTGSHTWYNFQDGGTTNPPPIFDFETFLIYLRNRSHNYFRLWHMENGKGWPSASNQYFRPEVYSRPGPGNAADGDLKYDLTSFNQTYFDRMRTHILLAAEYGMYVAIILFNGFSVEDKGDAFDTWDTHPYNLANNINSVNGDPNSIGTGSDTHRLVSTPILNIQKAYIDKVLATVNDLDNVLYEISNESNSTSQAWQYALIDYIQSQEAGMAKQHPIVMSVEYPGGDNAELFSASCNAESVSPNGDIDEPDVADGSKVILWDTDHITGTELTHATWPWRTFCRGNNPTYMDQYDGAEGAGADIRNDATCEQMRYAMGLIKEYAREFMSLVDMTPQNALASTGFCLTSARRSASEFFIFAPSGGSFTVDLSDTEAIFQVEWIRCSDRHIQTGTAVKGGSATQNFTSPYGAVASALYLKGDLVSDDAGNSNITFSGSVRITTTCTTTTYTKVVA